VGATYCLPSAIRASLDGLQETIVASGRLPVLRDGLDALLRFLAVSGIIRIPFD